MKKKGVDDKEEWVRLGEVRRQLDSMSDEKLLVVQKVHNMT